ncbi:penicillin-binding transpeptidase domain-containing protein [Oerskovia sp. M15]
MAAAYATFASGGTYCDPVAITRIVDATGNDLDVPSANCNSGALDPAVASTVTYALQNVMTQGSGKKSQLEGRPSAGKTGTAQLNTHNWFVGYTPARHGRLDRQRREPGRDAQQRTWTLLHQRRRQAVVVRLGPRCTHVAQLHDRGPRGRTRRRFPAPDPTMVGKVEAPRPAEDRGHDARHAHHARR